MSSSKKHFSDVKVGAIFIAGLFGIIFIFALIGKIMGCANSPNSPKVDTNITNDDWNRVNTFTKKVREWVYDRPEIKEAFSVSFHDDNTFHYFHYPNFGKGEIASKDFKFKIISKSYTPPKGYSYTPDINEEETDSKSGKIPGRYKYIAQVFTMKGEEIKYASSDPVLIFNIFEDNKEGEIVFNGTTFNSYNYEKLISR